MSWRWVGHWLGGCCRRCRPQRPRRSGSEHARPQGGPRRRRRVGSRWALRHRHRSLRLGAAASCLVARRSRQEQRLLEGCLRRLRWVGYIDPAALRGQEHSSVRGDVQEAAGIK
eukprot:3467396-Alexandrium_andersonii.AAC.3